MTRRPPRYTLFPYATLFRSGSEPSRFPPRLRLAKERNSVRPIVLPSIDRKSTRLNSSHRCTSYAVFCVEKERRAPDHSPAPTAAPWPPAAAPAPCPGPPAARRPCLSSFSFFFLNTPGTPDLTLFPHPPVSGT